MTIKLRWQDDAHSVLTLEFPRAWTHNDLIEMVDDVRAVTLNDVSYNHDIIVIADLMSTQTLPISLMSEARYYIKNMPDNLYKEHIVVGGKQIIKTIGRIINRVYSQKLQLHFVETFDEAYDMANQLRVEVS